MSWDGDRRKAKRVPISMKIGREGETLGFGYAQNISERGLAIDFQAPAEGEGRPTLGMELDMRFKLPASPLVISVRGRVVRIDGAAPNARLAIEFLSLTPDFESEIRKFVRQNEGSF